MIGRQNARHVRNVRVMFYFEEDEGVPYNGVSWRIQINLGPRKNYGDVEVTSWQCERGGLCLNDKLDRQPEERMRTEKALDSKLFHYTKPGSKKSFDTEAWKDILTTIYNAKTKLKPEKHSEDT